MDILGKAGGSYANVRVPVALQLHKASTSKQPAVFTVLGVPPLNKEGLPGSRAPKRGYGDPAWILLTKKR